LDFWQEAIGDSFLRDLMPPLFCPGKFELVGMANDIKVGSFVCGQMPSILAIIKALQIVVLIYVRQD